MYLNFIISKVEILIVYWSCLELNQIMQEKQNSWHHTSSLCDIFILTPTRLYTQIVTCNLLLILTAMTNKDPQILPYHKVVFFFLITDPRIVTTTWKKICGKCLGEKNIHRNLNAFYETQNSK